MLQVTVSSIKICNKIAIFGNIFTKEGSTFSKIIELVHISYASFTAALKS